MSSHKNNQYFETLEHDIKSLQTYFEAQKFAFTEKLARENCLKSLLSKSVDYQDLSMLLKTNKENLKEAKLKGKQIENEIILKSQELVERDLMEREHSCKISSLEKENEKLVGELEELTIKENQLIEYEREWHLINNTLDKMEELINEIERVDCVSEGELNGLSEEYGSKSVILRNLQSELEENTGNIGRQERYLLFRRGMDFVESIVGSKVLDCQFINDGFKVLIEAGDYTVWIVVINNKFVEALYMGKVFEENDVLKYAIWLNDPMYLINYMSSLKN